MIPVNDPRARSFGAIDTLAIGAEEIAQHQAHLGLLCRASDGEVTFIHLRTHQDLASECPHLKTCWIQVPDRRETLKQVAQFARLVAKKNVTNIPYGFRYRRGCLTTEGQYAHEENSGLTCATFVLAIFHTLGVEILSDRAQQPTLAGVLWQERVADHFSGFYPDIGSALKAQVGVPRFEPEEVAAGAGQSKRPLAQERAVEIGKSIREQLRQHRLRQEAIEAGAASLTGRGQVSES